MLVDLLVIAPYCLVIYAIYKPSLQLCLLYVTVNTAFDPTPAWVWKSDMYCFDTCNE